MSEPEKTAILVVGMHRSGTSALTHVLSLLGFATPKTLMPASPANEAGYWESMAFMDLDNRILRSLHASWTTTRPFTADELRQAQHAGYGGKIVATLRAEFEGAPRIILKDPRICRLVPLFRRALRRIGYHVLSVLPLRHPMDVAASLNARNGMEFSQGLQLWLRYNLDAERGTRGYPRAVIPYEQLMAEPVATLARATRSLDAPWLLDQPEAVAEACATLRPDLQHHTDAQPLLKTREGRLCAHAYEALSRLVNDPQDLHAHRVLGQVGRAARR